MSWLKKNELDIKRHVFDLRDTIKNNWSTTGQEVGKELRQFWQNSRPSSPARASMDNGRHSGIASPSGHGSSLGIGPSRTRLDPHSPGRSDSPSVRRNDDFATGYSLGLVGGVRSWVSKHSTPSYPLVHSFIDLFWTNSNVASSSPDDAQPHVSPRLPEPSSVAIRKR